MKVTRKFIEGFVEGCYENGLTEKQASWLLDRYIAEGNGEIMEKSAAGKSIINLLLLLLALGGGAYGLDRLGGTNTALGKWLKDNLGAGSWGIKDALEGLFSPAANPATAATAPAAPAPVTPAAAAGQGGGTPPAADNAPPPAADNPTPPAAASAEVDAQGGGIPATSQSSATPYKDAWLNKWVNNVRDATRKMISGGANKPAPAATETVAQGEDNKPAVDQSNTPQATNGWGKEWSDNQYRRVTGNDSWGIGDELRMRISGGANKTAPTDDEPAGQPPIYTGDKPTQITATPPEQNVDIAPLPKVQVPEAVQLEGLNLSAMPEVAPTVDDTSMPVEFDSPVEHGQYYALTAPAREKQRQKDYHQDMRDMTNNALNALAPMEDPLGEDIQPEEGVDYKSRIKDLEGNLHYYELMRQNEKAKAALQRKAEVQEWLPLFKQKEGPLEMRYENVDFPEDKNVAPIRDNRASLSMSKPTSKSQSTWFSLAPPVDTKVVENYLRPARPKKKTAVDNIIDAVGKAPAGMTY